jgi:hypothetical protein
LVMPCLLAGHDLARAGDEKSPAAFADGALKASRR